MRNSAFRSTTAMLMALSLALPHGAFAQGLPKRLAALAGAADLPRVDGVLQLCALEDPAPCVLPNGKIAANKKRAAQAMEVEGAREMAALLREADAAALASGGAVVSAEAEAEAEDPAADVPVVAEDEPERTEEPVVAEDEPERTEEPVVAEEEPAPREEPVVTEAPAVEESETDADVAADGEVAQAGGIANPPGTGVEPQAPALTEPPQAAEAETPVPGTGVEPQAPALTRAQKRAAKAEKAAEAEAAAGSRGGRGRGGGRRHRDQGRDPCRCGEEARRQEHAPCQGLDRGR